MSTYIASRPLESVNDSDDFVSYLVQPEHDGVLAEVVAAADATLIYSRHHWLMFDGEYHGRKEFRDIVTDATDKPVGDWTDQQATLFLCLFALRRSGIGLEQVDEVLTTDTVRAVLAERLALYLEALGHPRQTDHLPLIELARRVGELRVQIERDYHRYSLIDGKRWYRREGLIPRRSVHTELLPQAVIDALRPFAPDVADDASMPERLAAATRQCLADHGQTVAVLDAILDCAVRDPQLRVDHATVTCVRGVLLECPALLADSSQFFTRTSIAEHVEVGDYREQLGHASEQRLRATLKARMIKLKRKAVGNYFGDGCLAGEWIEKAADNMIFFHEDSHYRGHQTVGVSTGGRAAFSVSYQRGEVSHTLPPMMGDFRVVRLSHDEADRFDADALVHVLRYAEWVKHVVQETFRAGGILERLDDSETVDSSATVDSSERPDNAASSA